MSSFIQLPFGLIETEKTLQLPLSKNYAIAEYYKRLPHIDDIGDPKKKNEAINLIENRADFRKFLLATSDFGQSVQDNIDSLVTNGEYNNAGLRRTLDSTDSGIFKTANPLSLIFKNANKFDLQNPALGNLLAQIQAGQLSDKEVKRLLNEGENLKIEARLKALKKFNKRNDDDEGGDGGEPPGPSPPSDGSDKKPWRKKGPIRPRTPPPTKERVWWKHLDPQPPQPAVRPRPKPPPRPYKYRIPKLNPDQLIKEGLRKPEPAKKSDIPPFIDRDEDDDGDDNIFSKLPSPPGTYEIDTEKPMTKLVNKDHNLIKVIPKVDISKTEDEVPKIDSPVLGEVFNKKKVSSGVEKAFPSVKQKIASQSELNVLKENPEILITESEEMERILEHLANGGSSDQHESLQFFHGGENQKLVSRINELKLGDGNEYFIDFLLSEFAFRIMEEDKLKIHIESGDIYFDKYNTGESLFDFLKMQQNENHSFIDRDFYYNGSYDDYFRDFLNDITGEENTKYDYLTNRNAKYLFYRFNDMLLNNGTFELIKIRHSEKVKDDIAIAEIEKNDWQYFIISLIDNLRNIENEVDEVNEDKRLVTQSYKRNFLITQELYNEFYTNAANIFTSMLRNLPVESKEKIQNDLQNNGFERLNFDSNLESSSYLDKFIQFYYENGRFPSNYRLIIIPRVTLPTELENTKPIKLRLLYQVCRGTEFNAFASFQAMCALLIFLNDNVETKKVAKKAMEEYFMNLTSSSLNENDSSRELDFAALEHLNSSILEECEKINLKCVKDAQNRAMKMEEVINEYKKENLPTNDNISNVNDYSVPLPGPLLSPDQIKKEDNEKNIENIKTELAVNSQNAEAIEQAYIDDKRNILNDILNPTPGAVVENFLNKNEDQKGQINNTTDKLVELGDYDKQSMNKVDLNKEIPIIKDVPEIKFEDFEGDTTTSLIPPAVDYTSYATIPQNVLVDNKTFQKPDYFEPEIFYIDDDDFMIQLPDDKPTNSLYSPTANPVKVLPPKTGVKRTRKRLNVNDELKQLGITLKKTKPARLRSKYGLK